MLIDKALTKDTIARIATQLESFSGLKGETGLFATGADRQDRELALANAPALGRNLENYIYQREEVERRHYTDELEVRTRGLIDITTLSSSAKQTLERIRDAIDRNDLPAGLQYALADKIVKAELEGFARAIS
jgi:hypothetical protein